MVLIQILCVVIVILGLMMVSVRAQDKKAEKKPAVSSETMKSMSRADIQRALKKIESNFPPPQKMGAMCYSMLPSPDSFEYVCPVDGEKVFYSQKSQAFEQMSELQSLRGMIESLRASAGEIVVALDEHKLCTKCSPGLMDAERYVTLVLQYPDGRMVRTDRVTSEDLRYLIGFFADGLSYKTFTDGRAPLKPVEGRLKQLLGEK